MHLDLKNPFVCLTFGLAALVVGLQVEAWIALTGVRAWGVRASVFAHSVRCTGTFVDVHTGNSVRVKSETCRAVTPLQGEKHDKAEQISEHFTRW